MTDSTAGRRPRWQAVLGVAVFAAFLVFVELYYGWGRLLAPWASLSPALIAAAAVVVFASYAVRALRLYDYFRTEMRGRFGTCLRLFLQHNLLNNLLPMRSGELSFPLLMSRYFGISPMRSMPALVWFRVLDLHTLLVIALFLSLGQAVHRQAAIGALVAVPLPYLGFRLGGWIQTRLAGHSGRFATLIHQALQGLPQSPRAFWLAWLWTLINWGVKLGVFAWVLMLFIDVSPAAAWLATIAGDLTSVLPVHSVAGAGTFEAGVVAALMPFGVSTDQALAAAVNLHLFLLGSAAIAAGVSMIGTAPAAAAPRD